MKKIKTDLHMHTTISDGDYTPKEIIDITSKENVSIISITDHDTVEAYKKFPDLFDYAKSKNIELIPGIELSTRDDNGNKYHIVGLFIDINNKELLNLIDFLQNSRKQYVKESFNLFKKIDYYFDLEKILKEEVITKAHIANYILNDKKNTEKLIQDFGKIPTMGNFIETFMLKGQKCFVKQSKLHPKKAIETIKNANGVSFLAHPSYNLLQGEELEELIKKFKRWSVDGFEAYNIEFDRKNNPDIEVNNIKLFEKTCLENDLLISGGSDFHTDDLRIGKSIYLGDERISIGDNYFNKIKDLYLKRKNKINNNKNSL